MTDLSKEIPDRIFVPLGRKGFHPIYLKACIKCGEKDRFVLDFLEKKEHPIETAGNSKKVVIDYKVQCKNCDKIYYIRMIMLSNIIDGKEKRMVTNFNILDENGNDEGWLGTCYE